jgi:hypothetical protein
VERHLTPLTTNLVEEEQVKLNRTLNLRQEEIAQRRLLRFRWNPLCPTSTRRGGSAESVEDRLKRIDTVRRRLVFYAENGVSQGRQLALEDVCGIRPLEEEGPE